MSEGRISILIADDHPVVREGLRGMLSRVPEFAVVGEAATGTEAVRLVGELEPRVVLMDLRMPDMDGIVATREIRAHHPDTYVLVLTTHDGGSDILRSIETGATGYMLKDSPREELYEAIRAASNGVQLLAPAVAARLAQRRERPTDDALSAREVEVLELVARGTSNKEIAARLWISEATVKTHLIHVYDKLEVADRTSAVTEALRRGILSL